MSATLEFVSVNPLVSVQDVGRRGAMHIGVSESGPMDWARHRLALRLVDLPAGGPAVEVGLGGLAVAAHGGPVRLALTGPGFKARTREGSWTAPVALTLAPGDRLEVSAGSDGLWGYLAVADADWGAGVLGSHATNVRTGLGARDFAAALPCAAAARLDAPVEYIDPLSGGAVALLPGPQHHLFSNEAHAALGEEPYRLTPQIDRMGYRLEGPKLVAPGGHDIISDGIVEGSIQVPGNGQPIVLMADRAPTGGYPKIAVVASVDRPRLSQMRPGDTVRFAWSTREAALTRRRALASLVDQPQPRRRTVFSPQFLFERNLVDGVWPPRED